MHYSHSCSCIGMSFFHIMALACMGVGLVPYASVGNFLIVNVWAERRGTSLVHSMTKMKSKVLR
jgi:hypothetical protein